MTIQLVHTTHQECKGEDMPGLIAFILTLAVLAGYSIYRVYTWKVGKDMEEIMTAPNEDNRNMKEIIQVVYNQAQMGSDKAVSRNKVSKVLLMEDLNLRPKELKRYLGILSRKNLIKETLDYVTITPFGVQFYQVFQNESLNFNSSE